MTLIFTAFKQHTGNAFLLATKTVNIRAVPHRQPLDKFLSTSKTVSKKLPNFLQAEIGDCPASSHHLLIVNFIVISIVLGLQRKLKKEIQSN